MSIFLLFLSSVSLQRRNNPLALGPHRLMKLTWVTITHRKLVSPTTSALSFLLSGTLSFTGCVTSFCVAFQTAISPGLPPTSLSFLVALADFSSLNAHLPPSFSPAPFPSPRPSGQPSSSSANILNSITHLKLFNLSMNSLPLWKGSLSPKDSRNKACEALITVSIFKMLIYLIYLAASSLSCFMPDLSLWHPASLVTVHGLNCSEPRGILVPEPGIEPMSPALQGRFLSTGLPGKFPQYLFWSITVNYLILQLSCSKHMKTIARLPNQVFFSLPVNPLLFLNSHPGVRILHRVRLLPHQPPYSVYHKASRFLFLKVTHPAPLLPGCLFLPCSNPLSRSHWLQGCPLKSILQPLRWPR